jgi:SAM-dependent methyltransferase
MASMMPSWMIYQFGYSWPYTRGHLLVGLAGAAVALLCYWRAWPRWAALAPGIVALWGLAGAASMHYAVQINEPQRLVTERFLPSGSGRVLDLGAGSGRATVGLLLARPKATVTAVDLYQGYFGIDDNTPERLRANARIAGVDDRVRVEVADMRVLPFEPGVFDAAMSVAAIDHLRWDGVEQTLGETARVLKPDGQFLIVSLNVDTWVRIAMPSSIHGHGYWGQSQNVARWRDALAKAGFTVVETGTKPATLYFLAQRRETDHAM